METEGSETPGERAGTKQKGHRATAKGRRGNAERALSNIRAAKKRQREISDPVERAQILLAEANVLAILELADAIGGASKAGATEGGAPASSE